MYVNTYIVCILLVDIQIGIHVTVMAEAVVIVSLVASIASLAELSTKVSSRLHDFSSKTSEVPESFRSLSICLPLLMAILQQIQSQAEDGRFPDNVTETLKRVVDDTSKQVSDVHISLSKILSLDGASKLERAVKALKSLAKEYKIHQALDKIARNNKILVLYQTIRHVDTDKYILEAVSQLNIAPPTLPDPSSNIPFRRDPDFIDRGAILNELLQKYALPASRMALVGFGGVG